MRIYNGKDCQISVPMLGTNQMLELGPKSVSGNIMPTNEFLTLLTKSFTIEEIAFIVAGQFEYQVCASIPMASNFVATSLDEAISRFAVKKEETPVEKLEKVEETVVEEPVAEPVEVVEDEIKPAVEETPVEEAPVAEPKKKSTKKSSK